MAQDENRGKEFSTNKKGTLDILNELFRFFQEGEEYYSSLGIVKSVNLNDSTAVIEVINGDTIEDVRLQQVATETGLLIVPSVNSPVLVSWTDKTTCYISLTSHVANIVFQNGTFGGLIKISDLTTKLNELVDKVNDITEALTNHVHVSAAPGLPSSVPTPLIIIADAEAFDEVDYENENFKH